jgi:hypothetical protein
MTEDGQHIDGADRNAENAEQGSVTRSLLTDAAIAAGPSLAVYLNHYLNKPKGPPPPPPPQQSPKQD